MFMTDRSAFMTPQNATLDSKRTLSWFVSYWRLSSQFQFSLSAATLGYLSQWVGRWQHIDVKKERGVTTDSHAAVASSWWSQLQGDTSLAHQQRDKCRQSSLWWTTGCCPRSCSKNSSRRDNTILYDNGNLDRKCGVPSLWLRRSRWQHGCHPILGMPVLPWDSKRVVA
jgi:hypothetical protein